LFNVHNCRCRKRARNEAVFGSISSRWEMGEQNVSKLLVPDQSLPWKAAVPRHEVVLLFRMRLKHLRAHLLSKHKINPDAKEESSRKSKEPKITLHLTASNQESRDRKLAEFSLRDMRPLAIVEGEGFQAFCAELCPTFLLRSRGFYKQECDKIYIVKLNKVCVSFACCCDCL
jgi:hypothetical protein